MGGAAENLIFPPHSCKTSSSHHIHDGGVHSDPFRVGASVEVRTHEPDFEETFFSATVISLADSSSGKIQVEYRNLLAPRSRTRLLREYVDVSCVRPQPPSEEAVGGFGPGDVVDALFQDGWWIGIVTRVLEEGSESKYIVTFQSPPDEREFGLSELRVHWDWVNGSWVRPDRQSIAGLIFNMKKEVEVSFDREDGQDAWYPAIIDEHLDNGMYLVKYCGENKDPKAQTLQIKVDSLHLRPRPPLLKDNKFVLLEKVDAYFDRGWWSGLIRRELENSEYLVTFKQLNIEKVFHQSGLRSHMEWKDGKWLASPQDVMIPSSEGGMEERLTSENSCASMPNFPVDNFGDRENTVGKKYPFSLTPGIDKVEKLSPDSQKAPDMTPLTRRRKRLSDLQNSLSECQKKLKEPVLVEKQQEKHDRTTQEMLSEMSKKTYARKSKKKIVKESLQPKKSVSEREKRQNMISPQVEDSVDASGGKSAEINSTPDVNTANCEALNIELDDQPHSKCIGGRRIQSPSAVDGSRLLVDTAVEESIENRVKQGDIVTVFKENPQETQTQISTEHQNLPFAKTNLLWKTIEPLDAFRMLPQNPHFQPLENVKESMREGLAIGHMVNFISMIKTTSKLQFDDPKSTMYDSLEMLAELETHGFNIGAVRARVANLLAVKDKEAGLEARARELNCQISGHQLEIENLKEQERKLQEKLSQLQSAKERKEDEMASYGSQLRETEQSIQNLRHEFNSIAVADAGNV